MLGRTVQRIQPSLFCGMVHYQISGGFGQGSKKRRTRQVYGKSICNLINAVATFSSVSPPCGSSASPSTRSTSLAFLSHLFTCSFTEDMPHLEKSKLLKLVKWHIVDWPWLFSDGLVKTKDLTLSVCIGGCEVWCDVISIPDELSFSMRENELHCLLEYTKYSEPVPMNFSWFGWLWVLKMEFEVTKGLVCSVINNCWVDFWNDDIKVNSLALKHLDPLRVGELWQTSHTEQIVLYDLNINGLITGKLIENLPNEHGICEMMALTFQPLDK